MPKVGVVSTIVGEMFMTFFFFSLRRFPDVHRTTLVEEKTRETEGEKKNNRAKN